MDDLSPGKGSRHTATLGDPATGEETSGYGGMENDPPWSRSWHRNLLITPLSETAKNRPGYASIAAGAAPRPKNPSPNRQWADKPRGKGDLVFRNLTRLGAALILVLAAALIVESVIASLPAIKGLGWSFFHQEEWDPVLDVFGAPAFVYGTLVSAFIAFVLATPFGFGISLYLTEIAPRSLRAPVSFMVELLAGIPSVVYGLWGIFVLAPFMRSHVDPFLMKWIGAPFFAPPSTGLSLLSAGLILSIMILPTLMAISRDVFLAVPRGLREAAAAMGATRWETMKVAVLGPALPGLLGAMMLGLGRALGETMAVTMIIGNRPEITANLLAPSHSIASVIANEFAEATSDIHLAALSELGLLLMAITLLLNIAARVLVVRTSTRLAGKKR